MNSAVQNTKVTPIKKLGQNYLRDKNILIKISSVVPVSESDRLLEIGPGTGALTEYLYARSQHLTVIELDTRVHKHLQTAFPAIHLIGEDFRKVNLSETLKEGNWKVFGNIPYYLTSTIIFELLKVRHLLSSITLLIQKEVAARIVAPHNNKEYGILSVLIGTYMGCSINFDVSPNVFFPKPKVWSSVITLTPRPVPVSEILDDSFFEQVIKKAFQQRRKTLRNSLRELLPASPSPELERYFTYRPEQLPREELITLANMLYRETLTTE